MRAIIIEGNVKEIAALVVALQEGQGEIPSLIVQSDSDIKAIAQAICDRRQEASGSSGS